ncbi:DUF92 domain-containing protein [Thermofilum pendens]|uniref:DUF92 domain-containing protein n=1 Tax=Thermofilum pendens (strain DSM 2475 / Hrk 5) TaxID=368408 RepID=A1RYF0_THEPD|nr:DUF92 domain-containing protein [Thermofilum pendens]ABL78230.1 protein of unknown function DUF92, transmembrane [Thermofilum pendens Hrk 5]
MEAWQGFAIGVILGVPLAAYARRKKYLSRSAAAASVIFSGLYMAGGIGVFAASLFFFFSSSALTKLGYDLKRRMNVSEPEEGRTLMQVVGAGGVAALYSLLSALSPQSARVPLLVGAYAAIASSNADTWASELGSLSGRKPRLITNLSVEVEPGTSGGVTLLGALGSLAGSLLTGLVALIASLLGASPPLGVATIAVVVVAGWLGEVLDSVVGATLQVKYYCPRCGVLTDKKVHSCGATTVKYSGSSWVTNEVTNIIATLLSSTFSCVVAAHL